MSNKCIRSKVLLYVEANPNASRSEIMSAMNLDGVQASNALAHFHRSKKLFASGVGRATTWTAVKPERVVVKADPLMAALFARN